MDIIIRLAGRGLLLLPPLASGLREYREVGPGEDGGLPTSDVVRLAKLAVVVGFMVGKRGVAF